MLSHEDPEVVYQIIQELKDLYEKLPNGEIKEMTVQEGKALDYLVVNFDFTTEGKVKISMNHHVDKVIKEFPGKLRNKKLSSPNTPKLFDVIEESQKLNEEQSKIFHRVVAQLLCIS